MTIKKILIANRGEIALRIIRACKEMGIKSVAICPQKGQEGDFLETKFADEFYYLGQEGILGYLNQRKIIEIAKKADATAIHPGYGFLAENGNFADLCRKNGIKFIGPNGDILRRLGNKIEARKIAKIVGCPLLPSSNQAVRDEKECFKAAKTIGPPFLLKAANGGGGIGMVMFEKIEKKELSRIFQKLKREVQNAFGSDEIFIEKFLPSPHHIEIQILGDGKGRVWHFGERECSLQRRHQKLVEEAPSPFLDKGSRKKIAKLAVKFGEYLRYESLGTVEFLVDKNRNFYFIEVNPRLQVEHPVTELVYGQDLVELQIRIAQGEELDLKQRKIKPRGSAMEFRIYAEDALEHFKPQEGVITNHLLPGGRGIEIHGYYQPGQKILPYFDPLISKLVVFGKDRSACLLKAKRALDEYMIEGIETLIPFYKILLENKKFQKGDLSTSFIKEEKLIDVLRQRKIQKAKGEVLKEGKIEEKEIAKIAVHFYLALNAKEERERKVNKWRLAERMKILED